MIEQKTRTASESVVKRANDLVTQVLEVLKPTTGGDKERQLTTLADDANALLDKLAQAFRDTPESIDQATMQVLAKALITVQLCLLSEQRSTRLAISTSEDHETPPAPSGEVMELARACLTLVQDTSPGAASMLVAAYNHFVTARDRRHSFLPYTTEQMQFFAKVQVAVQTKLISQGVSCQLVTEKIPELISFGRDELPEEERAEAVGLKLIHRDISHMSRVLQVHSSGGMACVPLSYAYLRILNNKVTDPQQQETIVQEVLTRWKKEFGGRWVGPSDFFDVKGDKERKLTAMSTLDTSFSNTGFDAVDCIITYLEMPAHSLSRGKIGVTEIEIASKRGERQMIITTADGLKGRVVHVDTRNPYWRKHPQDIPRVGGSDYTAGDHALLVVDGKKLPDTTYEIYVIDPMTGCVLAIHQSELIRVIRKASDASLQTFQIQLGTCTIR